MVNSIMLHTLDWISQGSGGGVSLCRGTLRIDEVYVHRSFILIEPTLRDTYRLKYTMMIMIQKGLCIAPLFLGVTKRLYLWLPGTLNTTLYIFRSG